MTVVRAANSFTMTTTSDSITGEQLILRSLKFIGTGMTAGQACILTDEHGQVMFKCYVTGTNINEEFIQGEVQPCEGLIWSAMPAAGTFLIIGRI